MEMVTLTGSMVHQLTIIKQAGSIVEGSEDIKPKAIDALVRAKIITNVSHTPDQMVFQFTDDVVVKAHQDGLNVYKDGALVARASKVSKRVGSIYS